MHRIAVSGKGGSGKTTLSALIIKSLLSRGMKPLLAVDADPAGCLSSAIGANAETTLGDIREQTRDTGGIPKSQFVEMSLQQALWEGTEGFDLISMGRPEGPGCYCFVNNLLRDSLERLVKSYQAVVIDCEAGMEHLSRRTVGRVDLLLLVSDLSFRGVRAAREMLEIARSLDNSPGKVEFILNCTRKLEPIDQFSKLTKEAGFERFTVVPFDGSLIELEHRGENIIAAEGGSPAYAAVNSIIDTCFPEGG